MLCHIKPLCPQPPCPTSTDTPRVQAWSKMPAGAWRSTSLAARVRLHPQLGPFSSGKRLSGAYHFFSQYPPLFLPGTPLLQPLPFTHSNPLPQTLCTNVSHLHRRLLRPFRPQTPHPPTFDAEIHPTHPLPLRNALFGVVSPGTLIPPPPFQSIHPTLLSIGETTHPRLDYVSIFLGLFNVIPAIFFELVANPLRCIFLSKNLFPKIALGQLPIPHVLPKNLVLIPPPRPAIGTSKIRRIGVQPCKSTQTDHHCQAKTDACPSAWSLADIKGHFYAQFYPFSQILSPSGQLLCPI